jgi:hypothetical protein
MKNEAKIGIDTEVLLKYLFEAVYSDGDIYSQTPEDESLFDEDKNAFYDIRFRPWKPIEELIEFRLVGEGHEYAVDLRSGMFRIDGAEVQVGEDISTPVLGTKFTLVFMKRHDHTFAIFGSNDVKKISHGIRYILGWETVIKGKKDRRIIIVK